VPPVGAGDQQRISIAPPANRSDQANKSAPACVKRGYIPLSCITSELSSIALRLPPLENGQYSCHIVLSVRRCAC
jgi:hypothetical protein